MKSATVETDAAVLGGGGGDHQLGAGIDYQSSVPFDADYLAEHVWIVGSPDTVTRKMQAWFDELGGPFGTLLIYSHDYLDNPAPWEHSMDLLANEVAPQLTKASAEHETV